MRNSRETTQSNHKELFDRLKSMRLSGMAEELEQQISNPNTDLLPFHERIERVVNAEWDLRFIKNLTVFLRKLH